MVGTFTSQDLANGDALINNYTYELVIKENASHQITAQTITKKGDQFYASAFARGSHSIRTQLIQINETSFDQIKIANELEACLMSNFLTYKNIDGHEILEGSYMSTSVNGKRNCGSGKVFLEKVPSLLSIKKTKVNLESPFSLNLIIYTTYILYSNTSLMNTRNFGYSSARAAR